MNFAKNDDDRLLLSKVIDTAKGAEKNHSVRTTQFLNGHELSLVQKALGKSIDVCFSAYGGYEDAERKVVAFYPDYLEPQYNIHVIKVTGRELNELSHRDFLGSALALGIRCEKIGDIIISEKDGFIICLNDISQYIISQLERIANKPVKLELCDESDIKIPQKKIKQVNATVSSLRLDAVISAGAHISRSEAAAAVKSGRVTVNWEQTENISYALSEGQIISVKGVGRMELAEIRGETKKGRIAITINRFI